MQTTRARESQTPQSATYVWGKRFAVVLQRVCVHLITRTYFNALAHTSPPHVSHLRQKIVPFRRTDVAQANPRFRSHDLVQNLLSLFLFLLLLKKERGQIEDMPEARAHAGGVHYKPNVMFNDNYLRVLRYLRLRVMSIKQPALSKKS